MGLAFYYAKAPETQWRGPLGLALVWPFMMLLIICFVPESPRWLLMKGREEEAWKVVSDLHADPDDPDQAHARREFYQMQKQTEMDRTFKPTWKQMFVKPSHRKRAILAIVFYNELFPNHIRAKAVALAIMSIALSGLVYLQATPEAFARIAWKFYLVSTSPIHSLFLHHPKDINKNATRSSSASWPSA
jgi:hypothetical protein